MSAPSTSQYSISRAEFLDSFIQLYNNLKDYESLIQKFAQESTLDAQLILSEVQNRVHKMEFDGINLKSMEMIGSYLKHTLDHFKGDTLNFQLSDDFEEEGIQLDDSYVQVSKDIELVEGELNEIDSKILYLIRLLPPKNVDKLRLILKAHSSLLKSIIRKDFVDMENQVNYIHHLTANRESFFMINEIGQMARGIHQSLQDFSESVPTDQLDGSVMDEMPDAVDKLNLVIRRMETAANSTLDEVEGLLEQNADRQEHNANLLTNCEKIDEKLMALKEVHPDAGSKVDEILELLNSQLAFGLAERTEELKSDETIFFEIIGNQSFQDLTGQTLKKIIQFIEHLELSLVNILQKYSGQNPEGVVASDEHKAVSPLVGKEEGELVLEGPRDNRPGAESSSAKSQDDIDKMLAGFGF